MATDPIREPRRTLNVIPAPDSTCTISATVRDASSTPVLTTLAPRGPVRGVTLIAHGGKSKSVAAGSRLQAPAIRMYPFLIGVHRGGQGHGIATCQLRYRVRGYNDGDPVADVEWALEEIARRHGAVPVCLVGHSMGGRSVLRAAGSANVEAVAALAPWLPPGEPVAQLAGRSVVIAHGLRDRVTDPAGSLQYSLRAQRVAERLCRFEIGGSGHAMLERFWLWQQLVREVTLSSLAVQPWSERLRSAFALPAQQACRVSL
jgi:dienelactone hydrolase